MKKFFATVLAILLLVSFSLTAGCQKSEPQPAVQPQVAAPAEPEKKAEEAKPAETPAPAPAASGEQAK